MLLPMTSRDTPMSAATPIQRVANPRGARMRKTHPYGGHGQGRGVINSIAHQCDLLPIHHKFPDELNLLFLNAD